MEGAHRVADVCCMDDGLDQQQAVLLLLNAEGACRCIRELDGRKCQRLFIARSSNASIAMFATSCFTKAKGLQS